LLVLSVPACHLGVLPSEEKLGSAKGILEASGVKGGLVVVVGWDDPALLTDLGRAGSYLVHGLDGNASTVAAAREYIRDGGLYGRVTVSRLRSSALPYVDGLVNLIVASHGGQIPVDEMVRVLAPGGAIVDLSGSEAGVHRKAWHRELDEWTHYLYDASNNAVSNDTIVGPPRGLRWTCGPKYARSHEHLASVSAMVTAGGRVFTITDEGPISSVYLPPQWKLTARDAFSGVLLWRSPIAKWESHLRGFRSGPPEIGRRMVATADRVYVSLGYGEPVTVLDPSTGEQLLTLAGTGGARELLLTGGVLYVLADDMAAAHHEERSELIEGISPVLDYWYLFPRKVIPMYGTQQISAVKAGTGEMLWTRGFGAPGEIMPATMAVSEGRVCLQSVSHLVCLDAATGKELWRSLRPVAASRFSWSTPTLVVHDGVVVTVDRKATDNADRSPPAQGSKWLVSSGEGQKKQEAEMVAFSLADGKELWRAPCFENYNTPLDIFVIEGTVWVGNLRHGDDPGFTEGRDLKTGEIRATLEPQKGYGHHRCYRNKATVKWMLLGRNWIEFLDPDSGTYIGHPWVRGSCQYGVMPANGLIYAPQHSCGCNPQALLTGFNALSPKSSVGEGPAPLETGPAYGSISTLGTASSKSGWPTYRRDITRSGYQNLPAPERPGVTWARGLSPPITAPVVADGLVVVAETDRHTLHALSAADGNTVWTFVADGRIDSPPTLHGGLCLFGTRRGFVYCLRSSDGALVWRFRAAARDRRVFAYEQLESVWPVHGSVLVDDTLSDGVTAAYFAAGRSSYMDGGIRIYALEVGTGKVLDRADVTMGEGVQGEGIIRQPVLPDILTAQKGAVWMRGLGVDRDLETVKDLPHLYAQRGFLDDTWWHRTYWLYGTDMKGGYFGWPLAGKVSPAGRLLVFDGEGRIYGYGRIGNRPSPIGHPEAGHVRPDPKKDYLLFAEDLEPDPGSPKRPHTERHITWSVELPFVARSIVLTRDSLLVAGGASLAESAASHGPGALSVVSRDDGSEKAACVLPAPPVLDGMALSDEGVFVSAIDGSLLRLGDAE